MELTGEQLIRAPRAAVWHALNDPVILSRCVPGCEELSKVSDAEMHTRVLIRIGPVRARFAGKILMSDAQAPERCTLSFEGAGGAAGFAKGSSVVSLFDEGGATRLNYSVQASVGGKLGQIGGRLIDSSAKKMADEFFTAFETNLRDAGTTVPGADVAGQPAIAGLPEATVSAATVPAAAPAHDRYSIGGAGFRYELHRVFWFATGVAFTLLTTRWLP